MMTQFNQIIFSFIIIIILCDIAIFPKLAVYIHVRVMGTSFNFRRFVIIIIILKFFLIQGAIHQMLVTI